MQISKVESYLLKIPYRTAYATTEIDVKKTWEILLVRVATDDGVIGWGEAFGLNVAEPTKAVIDLYLAPFCAGRDPLDRKRLMHDLSYRVHNGGRNGPAVFALSGIEIALWDIAAKAAGVPLCGLLGSEMRKRIPAYASLVPLGQERAVAEETEKALTAGYTHVKLHEKTVETISTARTVAGRDVTIMVDTNCVWAPQEAITMAQRFQQYLLLWLEEPIWPPENFNALAEVRGAVDVAIAAGENIGSQAEFKRLFEAGAVDYAQPSVAKCGGIENLRAIMDLARTYDVNVSPHSIYVGPGLLATMHALAAAPQEMLLERLCCDLEADLFHGATEGIGGFVAVPDRPGLGVDPDPKVIAKYRVG